MDNCIIRYWHEEIGTCYWTGIGWLKNREKAKRFSLAGVEDLVERMRDAGDTVFWERYDKSKSS